MSVCIRRIVVFAEGNCARTREVSKMYAKLTGDEVVHFPFLGSSYLKEHHSAHVYHHFHCASEGYGNPDGTSGCGGLFKCYVQSNAEYKASSRTHCRFCHCTCSNHIHFLDWQSEGLHWSDFLPAIIPIPLTTSSIHSFQVHQTASYSLDSNPISYRIEPHLFHHSMLDFQEVILAIPV